MRNTYFENKQYIAEYISTERLAHRPIYSNVAQWEVLESQTKRVNFDNMLIVLLAILAGLLAYNHGGSTQLFYTIGLMLYFVPVSKILSR